MNIRDQPSFYVIELMAVRSCSWLFKAVKDVQGCSKIFTAVYGYLWLFLAVHSCS
jgi:hypothetical protein